MVVDLANDTGDSALVGVGVLAGDFITEDLTARSRLSAGNNLEVVAEVTDTRSGRVIGVAGPVHGAPDHPDSSLRVLGDSVVAILRRRHAPPG